MTITIQKVNTRETTMGHSQADKAQSRERILRKAADAVRDTGLESVSVSKLMRSVDLTHGGFYNHFTSRSDLLAQALERALVEGAKSATASVTPGDAPRSYGPHKTIYNRFIRWSRLGVFNRIFAELAGEAGEPDRIMIDATHLKAHRTAASLLKGGLFPDVSGAKKARTR